MKNLCVIGTGYIGLVGAAVFAEWGNNVVGVDIDSAKIDRINSGDMPIFEPGLSDLVMKNISEKRLLFTTDLEKGLKDAEIVFICVGTPQSDDGHADLSYVYNVAASIGKNLHDYKVIVTKSTVPVGTNEKVEQIIKDNLVDKDVTFDVASNPEFLREGYSVDDMMNTDRTVIGTKSDHAKNIMCELYAHLNSPIVTTDLKSAEMIKYASNSFLAAKITFVNELANLCDLTGSDIKEVTMGMGLDSRIGPKFLNAGIGYGGSCFPKDVSALYKTSMDYSYEFKMLSSIIDVNFSQKYSLIKKVTEIYGENLDGKTFACLGLAFKENTDDIRDSVAIKVIQVLRGMGAKIQAFDYQASNNAKTKLGNSNIVYSSSLEEALKGSNAALILTEWKEFAHIDLNLFASNLKDKNIFDGRNMYTLDAMNKAGLNYYSIGRRSVVQ